MVINNYEFSLQSIKAMRLKALFRELSDQPSYIDYKYQLSQVITKYIRKQFEYHFFMILRFYSRKFANEQKSVNTVWLLHMSKLIRSTLFVYWSASLNS